jgi:hypothetical protein
MYIDKFGTLRLGDIDEGIIIDIIRCDEQNSDI